MTSPFKECLLVPASYLIKKKKSENKPKNPKEILSNKKLPADVRLKYFDSFVKFNKEKESSPVRVITKTEEEAKKKPPYDILRSFLSDLPDAKLPLVKAILEFITESKEITWDRNFQVVIDKQEIRDSDIRKILQYFVGLGVHTSEADIPTGSEELRTKLEQLEIPSDWFGYIPRTSARTKRRKTDKSQSGDGKRWIIF